MKTRNSAELHASREAAEKAMKDMTSCLNQLLERHRNNEPLREACELWKEFYLTFRDTLRRTAVIDDVAERWRISALLAGELSELKKTKERSARARADGAAEERRISARIRALKLSLTEAKRSKSRQPVTALERIQRLAAKGLKGSGRQGRR